ncbi:hypothetical protein SAMN04515695_2876 [Pseudovibrio sp. Tun.PSC04-5.I4]|nr:hypothetical protein SAMN04515695_2876 [Pseudovibrio sp. Tun.PSC04-5.I4]
MQSALRISIFSPCLSATLLAHATDLQILITVDPNTPHIGHAIADTSALQQITLQNPRSRTPKGSEEPLPIYCLSQDAALTSLSHSFEKRVCT